MGKGRRLELDVKNGIVENTTESVDAFVAGYSGNSSGEVADVVVAYENDYGLTATYLELKYRTADKGNRATVLEGSSQGDSGTDELRHLIDETPPWAEAAIGLKFDHKQMLVLEADHLLYAVEKDLLFDQHGLEARQTKAGNVSMRKSGRIVSQQSGDAPWLAVCKQIGVPEDDIHG
jgi:hypothetical protein